VPPLPADGDEAADPTDVCPFSAETQVAQPRNLPYLVEEGVSGHDLLAGEEGSEQIAAGKMRPCDVLAVEESGRRQS
jgi:hypothetical protein